MTEWLVDAVNFGRKSTYRLEARRPRHLGCSVYSKRVKKLLQCKGGLEIQNDLAIRKVYEHIKLLEQSNKIIMESDILRTKRVLRE